MSGTSPIARPLAAVVAVLAVVAALLGVVPPAAALPEAEFVSTWDTRNSTPPPPWDPSGGSSAADQIHLPLVADGTYDFLVDWGDGEVDQITSWNQAESTHTYASPGRYELSITGTLVGWGFAGAGDRGKILSVTSWGTMRLGNDGGYFDGAENLLSVPDGLDLTGTTDLSAMFARASTFTGGGLAGWDVSQVTNMRSMFQDATLFNEDIGGWNVGNVTTTTDMFYRATAFNQDVGDWDVSSVTSMAGMFDTARAFDQDISGWDVSNATTLWAMFADASSFDQDLSRWDVSNVTDMSWMFKAATSFDQDLSGWDVGSVTNMNFMFRDATSFDQDLSGWDVTSLTTAEEMFRGVRLSVANYDALLNGWSQQSVRPGVTFDGGLSQYTTAGAAGRQALVDEGWSITDGGQVQRWFTAQPDPVAFGPVPVQEFRRLTVSIENVGSQDLEFPADAVRFSAGAYTAHFGVIADSCSGSTVWPGEHCTVEIGFVPVSPGAKTETMTLAESSGEPLPEVALTGTGMGPGFSASPAPVNFGDQRAGTVSDVSTVTVTNTGTEPLQVRSVALAGDDARAFAIDSDACSGAIVAPDQQCQVGVRFAPIGTGPRLTMLRFHDNARGTPQGVPLIGTAVAPWFRVAPVPHHFGDQRVGTVSDVLTMTMDNVGSAVLHVGVTELAGPDADQFWIVDQSSCAGKSLAPDQSCKFRVAFRPTTAGAKSAWLRYSHDGQGAMDSALQGTGTAIPVLPPEITGVDPAAGPDTGGNRVVIRGRHLAAAKAVRFGGVVAKVVSNTDTEVRVTAPKHAAGSVAVTVVTAGGTDTVTDGYRFTATPTPVPPGPPSAVTFTPGKRSTVRWAGAANATGYQVKVNGRLACSTAAATSFCKLPGKLGPKSVVKVRSTGADGTHSAWVTARYRANPVPVLLATVHFPPFSARLTAKTKHRLRQVATLLEAQGFRSLVLTGFTARIPGKGSPSFRQRLSRERAVAVKRFLQRRLDKAGADVRIRIRAKGGRDPVGDNNTRRGRAENRRAQVTLA